MLDAKERADLSSINERLRQRVALPAMRHRDLVVTVGGDDTLDQFGDDMRKQEIAAGDAPRMCARQPAPQQILIDDARDHTGFRR